MKIITTLTLAASFAALVACSKNEEKPLLAIDPENAESVAKAVVAAALPKADKTTPESSYRRIDDPMQLVMYASALSGLPVDYEALAKMMSEDYRRTSDNFQKQDILNALKPKIDSMLVDAKTNRYFIYKLDVNFEPYDFDTKSFPTGMDSSSVWTISNRNSNALLQFTNADSFKQFLVPDEKVARNIEGLRSSYALRGEFEVYAYAQEKDLNGGQLKSEIVMLRLVDQSGNALAVMK